MSEKTKDPDEPSKLNDEQRKSFRPEKEPELHHFPAGTRFYKHADSDRVGPGYNSAYWSPVEPVKMKDGTKTEGMKDVSDRYGGDAEKIREHGRYRNAVSYDWSTKMDQRVEIETTKDQWGYVGRANNQPYDKSAPNVTMMGGDHQVVLPAMKEGDFKYVDKGAPIAGGIAEQRDKNEALAGQRLSQQKVDPTQRPPSQQSPPPRTTSTSPTAGPPPRPPSKSPSDGPPPRSSTPPSPSNSDPNKGRTR